MSLGRKSLSIFLLMGAVFTAAGQTQAINGSIRGRVTDAAGASVPAAKITISNDQTGFSRSLVSDDDGYYVFPNLPLGTYTVSVLKEGFATQKYTGVALTAGTEAVLDSRLNVGAVTTEVEVSGGAPIIEPSRLNTGRTISHDGSGQPSADFAQSLQLHHLPAGRQRPSQPRAGNSRGPSIPTDCSTASTTRWTAW